MLYKVANIASEDWHFPTIDKLIENPDIEISDDLDEVYKDASEITYINSTLFPDNLDNWDLSISKSSFQVLLSHLLITYIYRTNQFQLQH